MYNVCSISKIIFYCKEYYANCIIHTKNFFFFNNFSNDFCFCFKLKNKNEHQPYYTENENRFYKIEKELLKKYEEKQKDTE